MSKVDKRAVGQKSSQDNRCAWTTIAKLLHTVLTWPDFPTWRFDQNSDHQIQIARPVSLLPFVTAALRVSMLASDDSVTSIRETVPKASTRTPRKYVSKHFKQSKSTRKKTTPAKPVKATTITGIVAPLNIEDLSSDSPLTDVPSDIGSDPFEHHDEPTKVVAVKIKRPTKSPYFPNKPRPHFVACLPFPRLCETSFGLMQEKLAHDPFRLLLATIFLNKTPGERAMPVFYQLMKMYPSPYELAIANVADVAAIIHHLGFQNQRAHKCVEMAKEWVKSPPALGKRVRKLHYPRRGDGKDVGICETVADGDSRVAWEISHLPGLGPYSHDSWRMFCRDELRGLATSWLGEGASDSEFEPEWKRVTPTDKELRAYLTWLWLKEGWVWNKETGERHRADEQTIRQARGGGIVEEERDLQYLVIRPEYQSEKADVEKPAGDFIPHP